MNYSLIKNIDIYEEAEDTFMLYENTLNIIKKINKQNQKKLQICEIGIGNAYTLTNIANKYPSFSYHACDINIFAVNHAKKEFEKINILATIKHCNLFDKIKKQEYDIVLFNTPYLPLENNEKYDELEIIDKAIYGGKHGNEITLEFIKQLSEYLCNQGVAIIIVSSLSHIEEIENKLKDNLYNSEIIDKKEMGMFETLYCLKIEKNIIHKKISKTKIKNMKFLAKGKHSIVLEGNWDNKKAIIKTGKEKDIEIEYIYLEKLKNENFSPQIYFKDNNFVIREKIEGTIIKDFLLNEQSPKKIINIIDKILSICQKLDELGINKNEMTNPYKHIYITKNNSVKMIDYERCIFTPKPKNTTQFLQYIRRNINILQTKNIEIDENKLLELAEKHKKQNCKIKITDIISI